MKPPRPRAQTNNERTAEIRAHTAGRTPKFRPGQRVIAHHGWAGTVDVVYADLQSAIDSFAIPKEWYEVQHDPPRTPKTAFWFSVILADEANGGAGGAILAGEADLEDGEGTAP